MSGHDEVRVRGGLSLFSPVSVCLKGGLSFSPVSVCLKGGGLVCFVQGLTVTPFKANRHVCLLASLREGV